MENKNTMLLTVIAVATLLVAVVGATFAFFTVTGTTTSTTTNVATEADAVGLVTLTQGQENFYLNIKASHMANTDAAKRTYYATTDAAAPAAEEGPNAVEIANIKVENGSEDVTYYCTFDYSISTTGAEGNKANANTLLQAAGKLVLSTEGNVTGLPTEYALGAAAATGTGNVTITGTNEASISAYAQLTNLNSNQSDLAGSSFTTKVEITEFSCDTAQAGA